MPDGRSELLSACNTIAGDKPGAEALSGLCARFTIPAFLLMVAWNRLFQETVGVILAAALGFALGKIA